MALMDSVFGFSQLLPVQRTYNWDVLFPFIIGKMPGIFLSKYVQEVRFGEYTITDLSAMKEGAYQSFFASGLTINKCTMTFIKPNPDLVTMFFQAWKDDIVSPKGYFYESNNYKHNVYVMMSSTMGVPSDTYRLEGCFPTTFPSYDLSYGSEDIVKFIMEFSLDRLVRISLTDVVGKVSEVAGKVGEVAGKVTGKVGEVIGKVKGF